MKSLHKVLCSLLLVFGCTLGMFAGCGDPLANLKVNLSGDTLTVQDDVYYLTLIKDLEDESLGTATITAEVEGVKGDLLSGVEWRYDKNFLTITPQNSDKTEVEITALNPTNVGTVVNVYSVETEKASCKLVVNIVVKPQSATPKASLSTFGIPIGQDYKLNPADLFDFSPQNATVPEYTFEVAGRTIATDEVFRLMTRPTDGVLNIKAYPTNKDDYSSEVFEALTVQLNNVRAYMALTQENTILSLSGALTEITELELVENTSANNETLYVTTPNNEDIEITVSDPSGIIDKNVWISIDNESHTISFTGLNALDEWVSLNFTIKVAGVSDAVTIDKTLRIRVVDMPEKIVLNGNDDTSTYELSVYDKYEATTNTNTMGAKLTINLSPYSNVYNNIKIVLDDTDQTANPMLADQLLINGQQFNSEFNLVSGTTIYLRNGGGYGNLALLVVATDTETNGAQQVVFRKLLIHMEHGVTGITVDSSYLDASSGALVLQRDIYGTNNRYQTKTLNFGVLPATASTSTVTVRSEDTSIATVRIADKNAGIIVVSAVEAGRTRLIFQAESGVTMVLTVQVLTVLNEVTINIDSATDSKLLGPVSTEDITVGGQTVKNLTSAFVTNNTLINLKNNIYPQSAVDMIQDITITPDIEDVAYARSQNQSTILLQTVNRGDVTFTMTVSYFSLNANGEGRGVSIDLSTKKIQFSIRVFVPIERIEVNKTNVELLAAMTNISASIYDIENNKADLEVTVYPSNSEVKASSAVWTKSPASTTKLELSRTTGAQTTITANSLTSLEDKINVTVVVTITDINNISYTKQVTVSITKINRITNIYIDGYGDKDTSGLYFDLYKKDSKFDLNITIQPSNATNKNIEYLLFDAVKLNSLSDATISGNVIRIDSGRRDGNNRIIYDYYEVRTRTIANNPTTLESATASVVLNESTGVYSIRPKNPGYAFLYIIPQDILDERVTEITNLTPQLQNVSDTSSIRRIPITVADGQEVRYRLYTAEDVASIGASEWGLKSNYYLMNTIDMSNYLVKNPNWTPIGSLTTPFSGSIMSIGCDTGTGVPQSIVGWSLSKTMNEADPSKETTHTMYYGIFGAVTGEIKYINFSINNFTVTQTTRRTNLVSGDEYDFGALVGRLITTEGKIAEISNVNVTCSNLTYSLNKSYTDSFDVPVNIGAIGLIEANSIVNNVSAKITANLSSDDLKINFGAIAGRNKGSIGNSSEQTYVNYASANVTVKNSVAGKSSTLPSGSNIGLAVGKNCIYRLSDNVDLSGSVYAVSADGNIDTSSCAGLNIGGIVGYNYGVVKNSMSAGILQARGNIGGVAGVSSGTISNVSFEIYSLENSNCGIIGQGNVGGIVGLINGGAIEWAMTLGYNKNTTAPNIVANNNSILGGIVGLVQGTTTIDYSFVNASIKGENIVGGLIGQNNGELTISNTYVRGILQNSGSTTGALVGLVDSGTVSTRAVYAEIQDDFGASGSGTILTNSVRKTIVLVNNPSNFTSTATLLYIDKTSADAKSLNYFKNNGFAVSGTGVAGWNIKVGTNDDYPYLQRADGTDFVRVIPTSISIDAKDFETFTLGSINNTLNVVNADGTKDTKKLIIMYDAEMEAIPLRNLFNFSSDPALNVENVRMQITCSSNTVIQLVQGVNFNDYYINVVGTGTAIIKFVSSQNTNANDTVQIAVINGFNNFNLYEGADEDGVLIENSTPNYDFKIKNGSTSQAYVQYIFNGQAQESVDGGLRFSVSDDSVFSMSIDGWTQGDGEYYYYLSGKDRITLQALEYKENLPVRVTPFITATFYDLNEEGQQTGTQKMTFDILDDEMALTYTTSIYKGASSIAIGIASSTQIFAGDALTSAVTLFTDNYEDGDDVLMHIGYSIRPTDSTVNIVDTENGVTTDILTVQFGTLEYDEFYNRLVIPFSIYLNGQYKNNLSENLDYTITFWAIGLNGKADTTMTTTLSWSFIPQKINHIDMAHYSDAVNNGPKLQQAGELPTNTIIAGQFGLMTVKVSPDYAYYDYIDIVSDVTNGDRMMFDQRVLSYEDGVATYYSWQKGVEIIEGGIRLYRVSNLDGSFDGTYYIRTLVSELQPAGAVFTAHVNIYQGTQVYTNSLSMTVHLPDTLSISYPNYNSNLGYAYVAKGTGYAIGKDVAVQNRNELIVNVGTTYSDVTVTTESKTASIVEENGKYYLNTGSTAVGEFITVTLTGKQNLSGLINEVKRSITFLVVDFYINSISEGLVNGASLSQTMRLAYVKGRTYDLRIFEGATLENLSTITAITFDTTDETVKTKILNTINQLNGIGEDVYSGWSAYVLQQDGTYIPKKLNTLSSSVDETDDQKTWINDNYCFYNDGYGYKIEANGVSNTSRIKYDLAFTFVDGAFTLVPFDEVNNASRGYFTDDITLNFYQITSQEHAQPIYSEKDLLAMESGIDYIVMNDFDITSEWTPITTEISSLNGNGYTIRFIPASINSTNGNYGLFDTVTENMVIKNLNLQIVNKNITLPNDVNALSTLRFGFIAGVNAGTIHNCQVSGLDGGHIRGVTIPTPALATADFAVGGLVGENQTTGAISNSRISCLDLTAFGKVAGLVALNNGTISSCYYTGGTITNVANTTGSNVATAGLVVENANGAKIYGSYTGGAYTQVVDGTVEILTELSNNRDGIIQSGVRASGFVYSNNGTVSDCYSAMQIWAIESSGFAYSNGIAGVIERCYSVCLMTNNDSGITSVSMPFIGVEGTNALANNNLNPNGMINCYFFDTGFSASALRFEEAKALTAEQFLGKSGTSVFDNFIFSRTGEKGSEFTGVWVFVDSNNDYFTPDRFKTKLTFEGYVGEVPQLNFGPKLVSADLIATSRMFMLDDPEIDEDTGAVLYSYGKKYNSYFEKLEGGNADFNTDYSYDPVSITTATQFNNAFNTALDSVTTVVDTENITINGTTTTQTVTKIIDDIRLARNLDQSDIDAMTTLYSPSQNYAGIFDGNGFVIENLNLAINDNSVNRYGLFGTVSRVNSTNENEINHIGTIKNLNLTVTAVSCSQVAYVGALAGIVDSGNLYNITVTGTTARVIGNNAVGGVVGLITGTSRANDITAEIGVTVNYKLNTDKIYNSDLLKARESTTKANDISVLGYAGGVFGIADLTQFDSVRTTTNTNEAMLYNINAIGQSSIVGKISGGVAGLIGVNTVLNKATKIIDTNSIIKGYNYAGGLVGQNNGVIRYSNVEYTDTVQAVEDIANTGENRITDLQGNQITINSSVFEGGADTIGTGGLVGLNIGTTSTGWVGGTIYYSSSKIRVRNSNGSNVGGIVGVAYGGDIRAVFATGGILGNRTANLGGIVGYLSDFSDNSDILVANGSIANPFGENVKCTTTLDYCVALNNYLVQDYNYYLNIKNRPDASQGGLVGYCHNAGQIYTTHTVATGEDTPFSDLTNTINYYVGRIYNKIVLNTVTTSINDETATDTDINLRAVGSFGTGSGEPATAETRGYMLSHFDVIFGGWDSYSISNENGIPSINIQDVPDIIYIRSIEDYMQMYWHPDKTYILMSDIDFKGANKASVPIGSESAPFTGTFDGNGKTIYNMPIVQTSTTNAGMFGATESATITNVNLVNLYISTNLSEEISAYLGGVIGVARNTNVSSVNIQYNNSLGDVYHELDSSANYVGGMFGRIYTTENGTSTISDCYVYSNLTLTDNIYGSKNESAYLGGFAGLVQGNVTLKNIYAEGNLNLNCSSASTSKVTHIVGGLIGSASETVLTAGVSDVNININNVYLNAYVGGMFGISNEIEATMVDSAGDITLALNNLNAVNILNVGGLVGKSTTDLITSVIVSGDITLNGSYGVNVDSGTTVNENIHAVGGVVGVGQGQSIASGYSIATIKNNTRFTNIDLAIYAGDLTSSATLWCDSYLGLTAKDKLGLGVKSTTIYSSFDAENFTRPEAGKSYARLNITDWKSFNPSGAKYNALYQGETTAGDRKTAPITIATSSDFKNLIDTSTYKYYLQTIPVISSIDLDANKQLWGWYNGSGNMISTTVVDVLDYSAFTASASQNYGVFGQAIDKNGIGSVISGANVKVQYSSKIGDNTKFGGLVAELSANSKIFGSYVSGNVEIGLESGSAYVGGLVGLNHGQIIGSAVNINMKLYGAVDLQGNATGSAGSIVAGGLIGWSDSVDTRLTMLDSYANGTIVNNNSSNGTALAGLVGKVTTATGASLGFYNENCYSAVTITDNSGNATVSPVVAIRNGGATNMSGIYYDSGSTNKQATNWTAFSIASVRNGTNIALGSAYETNATENYGLPYLKLLSNASVIDSTGNGTANNPYLINSAGQVAWALTSGRNSYYKLTNDIDFTYVASSYVATNFIGHFDGNGYSINNISKTLLGTISGEVTKLGLTTIPSYSADILANTVSGTVNQIYANAVTGNVVGSGKIENSMSNGANFPTEATNCFTSSPNSLENLDKSIWVYTGKQVENRPAFELLSFVEEIGESYAFGTSVTMVGDSYLINTVEQFERLIAYVNANGGTISITFNGGSMSLGNKMLKTIGNASATVTIVGNEVKDGLIYRDDTNTDFTFILSNNQITNVSNCGIIINGNASIFGPTSSKYSDSTTLSISNSYVYASKDSALVLNTIERAGTLNVNLTNIEINVANGVNFYTITPTLATKTVNATISNVIANGARGLVGNNSGVLNVTVQDSTVNGAQNFGFVAQTNNGTINILNSTNTTVNGDSNVAGIAYENAGTITLTVGSIYVNANSGNVAGIVCNNGASALINIKDFTANIETPEGVVGGVACVNNGTIQNVDAASTFNANINQNTVASTTLTGGIAGTNNGTIQGLNLNATITGNNAGGVVGTNSTTGVIKDIIINNLVINGDYVGAIASVNNSFVGVTIAQNVVINSGNNAGGLFYNNTISTDKNIAINLNANVNIVMEGAETKTYGALCVVGSLDETTITVTSGTITLNTDTVLFPVEIPEPEPPIEETP